MFGHIGRLFIGITVMVLGMRVIQITEVKVDLGNVGGYWGLSHNWGYFVDSYCNTI
jgi:hypothetical protein